MNYKALEDLINILVKKSGYKLSDLKVLEDVDYLNDRKDYLEEEISKVKSRLNGEYIDKDKKSKYEEERKYLEDSLSSLNSEKSSLEAKLEDTSNKELLDKTLAELDILTNEIARVRTSIKVVNFKLDSKDYIDTYSKEKDEVLLSSLEEELKLINKFIDIKENNSIRIGNTLLEEFKGGTSYESVKSQVDTLVDNARVNYNHTLDEIKGSNIFELIDKYSTSKKEYKERVEESNYDVDKEKESIFEKTRYHNKRIEALNSMNSGIMKRKEELNVLVEESLNLYNSSRSERLLKEEVLEELLSKLYKESNLNSDLENIINNIRLDITNLKYLENKYNLDVQGYLEEIRNLDINSNNLQNEISLEERCLEILNNMLNTNVSLVKDLETNIDLINATNRISSLTNEQQYLYVNVDVIKEEIENIWSKGNDERVIEHKTSSMYDEDEEENEDTKVDSVSEENEDTEVENSSVEETKDATEENPSEEKDEFEEELEDVDYLD